MKTQIPKIAETLVQATNEKNVIKYLACFTEDAVYSDFGENETMIGRKAIEKNFKDRKYEVHTEPTSFKEDSNKITMQVKATGNFKGSPLNFEYKMQLRSGLIHDLKIKLVK